MSQPDTSERLLDAAEACFAEHGFAATSVRMVTQRADANLAAVHYHFGDKQGLLLATLARRIEPLNASRLAALDVLQHRAAAPSVAAVLTAFVQPCLDVARGENGDAVLCLLARVTSEPKLHDEIIGHFFHEVIHRFLLSLQPLLPSVPAAVLQRRFQFCVGALIHMMLHHDAMTGSDEQNEVDSLTPDYVDFCSAGLQGTIA